MGGGKGGGGGGQSTVTQKADPWSGIQPQLSQAAGDTQNLYNQGLLRPQVYGGQTYANFTPTQQNAMDLTQQRAQNGSPINQANNGLLSSTLNGDYLSPDSNPYLKDTFNKAADQVQGRVNSAFAGGGRSNSGLNQQVMGQNFNSLANDIYGGNYQQERTRQMAASALAPQAANQDYTDLSALSNVGAQQQGMNQNSINDTINRFNANSAAPGQNIQNYIGLLNGAGGNYGATTQTSPYSQSGSSGLGQSLGLLGNLGGIGSMLGSMGSMQSLPWLSTGANLASKASAFSDARLKENITLVDCENGHLIYNFNYKDDPEKAKYRGVMAQDVMHIKPEAVEIIDGYMAVDYGKLGIRMERLH